MFSVEDCALLLSQFLSGLGFVCLFLAKLISCLFVYAQKERCKKEFCSASYLFVFVFFRPSLNDH